MKGVLVVGWGIAVVPEALSVCSFGVLVTDRLAPYRHGHGGHQRAYTALIATPRA